MPEQEGTELVPPPAGSRAGPSPDARGESSAGSPGDCVFDRIADRRHPAHLVVDEPEVLAFLDIRPLFPGHTLVVPRRHVGTLAELRPDLLGAIVATAQRISTAFRPVLGAEGSFLAVNDEVSQSVPHVHMHVVPRRRKDGLRGFFWPRQRYESDEQAAQIAAALRAALERPPGS